MEHWNEQTKHERDLIYGPNMQIAVSPTSGKHPRTKISTDGATQVRQDENGEIVETGQQECNHE